MNLVYAVKQLLILIILTKLLQNIAVSEQYRKYIKLVCGLIVIMYILGTVADLSKDIKVFMNDMSKNIYESGLEDEINEMSD